MNLIGNSSLRLEDKRTVSGIPASLTLNAAGLDRNHQVQRGVRRYDPQICLPSACPTGNSSDLEHSRYGDQANRDRATRSRHVSG